MMMAVWQRSVNGVLGATSTHAHMVLRPMSFGAGQARPAPISEEEEFRVLSFTKKRAQVKRPTGKRDPIPPPRTQQMATDQHWPSVWPGPRSFHPSSVPIPLRQGYPLRNQAPPDAQANAELMKIPNFLHLTPPAIKEQCAAIKKFCNPWPAGLETDEKCEELFPLEIITSDYCHSGPSIRDPLSRIVTVRMKLSKMPLDYHAKDKIRRLILDKYDEDTDLFTITTDRCPLKSQNLDYAMYLLTAVYHEAWKVEPWEAEKTEEDMEVYIWKNQKSRKAVIQWFNWKADNKEELSPEFIKSFDESVIPGIKDYEEAVSEYYNVGENDYQVNKYKQAVLRMLGVTKTEQLAVSKHNKP